MLVLKKLKVAGFRGYSQKQEISLDATATILFGENHCGKSSTLNAIEWCLFGDACKGKDTGIRERVGWEFLNRHLQIPEVQVELELEGPSGNYLIQRTLRPRHPKSPTMVEYLTVGLPDGRRLSNEQAETELSRLVKQFSFRDFMTTVYQHQELIRGILTQEPRDRNDAIDRLLGLSDYRNLLSAIDQADLPGTQKSLGSRFNEFESGVCRMLSTRTGDLKDKRQEAQEAGIAPSQQNEAGALVLAQRVRNLLDDASQKLGVRAATCTTPAGWKELRAFRKAARADIDRMRSEMPESRRQGDLFTSQNTLSNARERYLSRKADADAAARAVREFEKEHGNESALQAKLTELRSQRDQDKRQLRETNRHATLIDEAIKYFEHLPADAAAPPCPLCGQEAPDLLAHLRHDFARNANAQLEAARMKIAELDGKIEEQTRRLKQISELNQNVHSAREKLAAAGQESARALGREFEPDDDPLALLEKKLAAVSQDLSGLADVVKQKQQTLTAIEGVLDKLALVADIVELEEKKTNIEQIKDSPAYKKLEKLRDDAARLVDHVNGVKDAIAAASHKEARNKIALAEQNIDSFFRRLTANPVVKKLKLTVESDARNRNFYEFKSEDGQDLRPVLSQGDLNALALSIFLGLACSGGDTNPFGFVILDDFSQSLGSEHKSRLASMLNDVLASKRLLLSTMDAEMRDLLDTSLTKRKMTYVFEKWTQAAGPCINRHEQ